jgi:uncharacterized protein YqfA (UPF0365 family)
MVIAVIIMIVIIMLLSTLIVMKIARLWLQAYFSCANVTIAELIGMWLRKEDANTIVSAKIIAAQGGLQISTRDLESHWLIGGDVTRLVKALVLAKKHNIEISFQEAEKINLLKERDVLEEIKTAIGHET